MSSDQIDEDGYRANVGIIVANDSAKLLLAGRAGRKGWQFPQGGVAPGETAEQAMFRELEEELGLSADDVELLGCTSDWIPYRLPDRYVRRNSRPICIGQKQRWFAHQRPGDRNALLLPARQLCGAMLETFCKAQASEHILRCARRL